VSRRFNAHAQFARSAHGRRRGDDIYRLENGKIVEHWDVAQDLSEKSANDGTTF
jgi:predicted SnoaL-like aldol condensation-catalyzing enzyme